MGRNNGRGKKRKAQIREKTVDQLKQDARAAKTSAPCVEQCPIKKRKPEITGIPREKSVVKHIDKEMSFDHSDEEQESSYTENNGTSRTLCPGDDKNPIQQREVPTIGERDNASFLHYVQRSKSGYRNEPEELRKGRNECMDLSEKTTSMNTSCRVGRNDQELNFTISRREYSDVIREIITRCFSDFESVMSKRLLAIDRSIGKRLTAVETELSRLKEEWSEVKTIYVGGNQSAKGCSTALGNFISQMKVATKNIEWIFDNNTLSKLLCVATVVTVVSITNENRGTISSRCKEAFHTLMFSIFIGGKAAEWRKNIGLRHSKLRKMIVLNAIVNAQNNRIGKFNVSDDKADFHEQNISPCAAGSKLERTDLEFRSTERPRDASLLNRTITQPRWLKEGFVTMKDIEAAQKQHEDVLSKNKKGIGSIEGQKTNGWYTVKAYPTRSDIATYGSSRLFSLVKAFLNCGRRNGKKVLFEHLFYLMVPWLDHNVKLRQTYKALSWCSEESNDCDLSQIPLSKDINYDRSTADEQNSHLYAQLLSGNKAMMLAVTHEVCIGESIGRGRKSKTSEITDIRKVINMIDVGARFCAAFTGSNEKDFDILPFLRSNELSLRCITAIAIVLRDLTEDFIQNHMHDGIIVAPTEESWPQIGLDIAEKGRKTSQVVIEDLIPGRVDRERLLNNRCLHLTRSDFLSNNVPLELQDQEFRPPPVELISDDAEESERDRDNLVTSPKLSHFKGIFHI